MVQDTRRSQAQQQGSFKVGDPKPGDHVVAEGPWQGQGNTGIFQLATFKLKLRTVHVEGHQRYTLQSF